ncbi:MAG: U32 family peptidase [Lactobacillales bacterium]|jgi:putative protease|nr:U32 family peptidase [Lactobacillales bacterium]
MTHPYSDKKQKNTVSAPVKPDFELLAPAGDIEAGYAALHYGADAVYLGLNKFSARAEAINFTPEQLNEFTAYAHAKGKKVYVTLNTLIQEDELDGVLETLDICRQMKVDAIIVQDFGVAAVIRKKFPTLQLHASTQMAVHNLEGALALKKLGFTRVVLARELSLNEIQKIQKESGLEIEIFVHGALCYSYSGLCFFSSVETGRSANRGKCVYACRGAFRGDGTQGHFFSMKDLALEEDVLKLNNVSLKIEGRKKNALYVAAAVHYCRQLLDTGTADRNLSDHIKQIFSRPWTKLNFSGNATNVTDPHFVGHRGLEIGQVEKIFNHVITFKTKHTVARYDGMQIETAGNEKPFGFSVEKLQIGGKGVFEAPAGQTIGVTLPDAHPFIKKGDKVYLSSSTKVKGSYPYAKPKPREYLNKIPLSISFYATPEKIIALANEFQHELSIPLQQAKDPVKTNEAINQAFAKTGDTPFYVADLHIHNENNLFVPSSVLNEFRRTFYEKITIAPEIPELPKTPMLTGNPAKEPAWIVKTDAPGCLSLLNWKEIDEVIVEINDGFTPDALKGLPHEKVRLALPLILRETDKIKKTIGRLVQNGFSKWEISNPGGLMLIPATADISYDHTLYALNSQAMNAFFETGAARITFSPEDTIDNIRKLTHLSGKTCFIAYLDIPLFISANKIENLGESCLLTNGKGRYELIQKPGQTILAGTKALSFAPESKTIKPGAIRMDFCFHSYSAKQVAEIVTQIKNGKDPANTQKANMNKKFA